MRAPSKPRVIVYFDAQNLYYSAKREFGYTHPNFDPVLLAESVARAHLWELLGVRVYTGIPSIRRDPRWHGFWTAKLRVMQTQGVYTFSRFLKYVDGVPREKGIDVRISLDIVRLAMRNEYDVALLFSQDQDLSEVAKEIREIACEQQRWIKIASAYPKASGSKHDRGVDFTDWIPIDRATYDACIDPRDYRPRK